MQKQKNQEHHAVVSTFDLFSIGIGPSSSHTVGPMRAAKIFIHDLKTHKVLDKICSIRIDLFGSLALTGKGHGTPDAILMGIEGETPEGIETATIKSRIQEIYDQGVLTLDGTHPIKFNEKQMVFHFYESLPQHPNGMRFCAFNNQNDLVATNEFFSIGGGFVVNEATQIQHGENLFYKSYEKSEISKSRRQQDMAVTTAALPFRNAGELLEVCNRENLTVAQVVYENELRWRSHEEIKQKVVDIWKTMRESIQNGCSSTEKYLPGNLKARRRAPDLIKNLEKTYYGRFQNVQSLEQRPLTQEISHPLRRRTLKRLMLPALDYLSVFAIAVNEENAAGGRVVTAPTNGAAGVIPAVLNYYLEFISETPEEDVMEFLLRALQLGCYTKGGPQ